MAQVKISYHKDSNTFIGEDKFNNKVVYKANREQQELAPVSTGSSLGPMVSLLMACGACSGIDVVLILEKQRQVLTSLAIIIKGEREQDVTPALWKTIDLHFELKGNLEDGKVAKAVSLSIEKYCSVLETLRRAGATVSYTYSLLS